MSSQLYEAANTTQARSWRDQLPSLIGALHATASTLDDMAERVINHAPQASASEPSGDDLSIPGFLQRRAAP